MLHETLVMKIALRSDQRITFWRKKKKRILLVIQLKYLLRRLLVNLHSNFLLPVSTTGAMQNSKYQL